MKRFFLIVVALLQSTFISSHGFGADTLVLLANDDGNESFSITIQNPPKEKPGCGNTAPQKPLMCVTPADPMPVFQNPGYRPLSDEERKMFSGDCTLIPIPESERENMILEKWYNWQPLQKMHGEYYIKSCTNHDFCSLTIILGQYNAPSETEIHIQINGIEAYKVTNETYKLKIWTYLSDTHKGLNRKWPLFRIEESAFLRQLSDESNGISNSLHFKHYCIMDSEWVIDIVTPAEPVVEIVVEGIVVESSDPEHRSLE